MQGWISLIAIIATILMIHHFLLIPLVIVLIEILVLIPSHHQSPVPSHLPFPKASFASQLLRNVGGKGPKEKEAEAKADAKTLAVYSKLSSVGRDVATLVSTL